MAGGALIGVVIGGAIGIVGSVFVEYLKDEKRKGEIAKALKAEVMRLQALLGPPRVDDDAVMLIANEDVPVLHPWMERVVIRAADVDPDLVLAFIQLQGELETTRLRREILWARVITEGGVPTVIRSMELGYAIKGVMPPIIEASRVQHVRTYKLLSEIESRLESLIGVSLPW